MGWNLQDYEPVEDRIRSFYEDNRKGRIVTEIAEANEDFSFVIFKATVYRTDATEPAATGFAYEKASQKGVNATSHIENCETSAIGRALANLGYGAKGKRPTREEMNKVVENSAGSEPVPAKARGSEPQAAPAKTASPPNKSQSGGVPEQGVAGGSGSAPPTAELWNQIQDAVDKGLVSKTKVHMAAARLCTEHSKPVPTKYPDVKDCDGDILQAIATQVAA